MEPILSPTVQGFDSLDLQLLAKATTKTFERLAPFSQLKNPSSVDATPAVEKIVNKIQNYIQAIEASMLAVATTYKLSGDAAALCDLVLIEKKEGEPVDIDSERRKAFNELVVLANDAYEKAESASIVFRQAEQDLFKIAAATKGVTTVVHIPIDPALPKTIRKSLQEIGSDLVANLSLLAEFYKHTSDLTNWCRWVKTKLGATESIDNVVVPALDGTEQPSHVQYISSKWNKIHADSLIYYSMTRELQSRYAHILPKSKVSWNSVMEKEESVEQRGGREDLAPNGQPRKLIYRIPDVIRDATRHLACHGCFIM